MKKNAWITIMIIAAIIVFSFILLNRPAPTTSTAVAKCIGKNSALYVQLGCSHCKDQETLFGDNYQYLNVTDCWFERDKCTEITATPTWIIKGEKYEGVQSIETLQQLTGC